MQSDSKRELLLRFQIEIQNGFFARIEITKRFRPSRSFAGLRGGAHFPRAHRRAPSPVQVHVRRPGGDRLRIGFDKTTDGYTNVTLTGPADFVFDGTVAA